MPTNGGLACFEIMDPNLGLGTATDTTFTGITANGCDSGILLSLGTISKVTITGAHILNSGTTGIQISSPATPKPPISDLTIENNIIDLSDTFGIRGDSSQSALGSNWTITGNWIGDSRGGGAVEDYGISLAAGTLTNGLIQQNTLIGAVIGPFNLTYTPVNVVFGPNITDFNAFSLLAYGPMAGSTASATSIDPPGPIFHVTGTTTIQTLTTTWVSSTAGLYSCITIIPNGVFALGTSGNIAIASTSVVGKQMQLCYDTTTTKWYPSY